MRKIENGVARQVSEVEVDMAPFIGKPDAKHRINFSKSEIPNCFLDIEFKLTETDAHAGDDSGDEEVKEQVLNESIDAKKYEDEINHLKEQLAEIKRESSGL